MDDRGRLEVRSEFVRLPMPNPASNPSHAGHEAAEVQAIRIGALTVIGVPGELFAQTALDLQGGPSGGSGRP